MAEIKPDIEDIEQEYDEVVGHNADTRQSNWPAMTYERGVEAAFAWVLGDREERPFTEA